MKAAVDLYFSQRFDVDPALLDAYGAFDVSVVSDLPLFVDPFLLFNSEKPEYRQLHDGILRYLRFLRDQATPGLDPGLIDLWYRFKEVKQNWLGFTLFGNGGAGLGKDFAEALHGALGEIFKDFGDETITRGSHLEKLCLIRPGVGKDNISDFTTNLIKEYLCEYTQTFARAHLSEDQCANFAVTRVRFNYENRSWVTQNYYLPKLDDDFVLLTPTDMLTRDETWINHPDMVTKFWNLPEAIPDSQLRAQINDYVTEALGEDPDAKQCRRAIADTIRRFPELIDRYIKLKEDTGDQATATSSDKVDETRLALVELIKEVLADLVARTEFYDKPWTTYEECLERARYFKRYVEDNDGYKLFNLPGRQRAIEKEVQLAFGRVWCGTDLDVNREVNNGRGPVDFKASYGNGDKSLIEFKLASNKQLKRNLQKQVKVYEAANQTHTSVKVILFYSEQEEAKVQRILKELELTGDESIVVIDARNDNKPSASKA